MRDKLMFEECQNRGQLKERKGRV